MKSVLTFTQQEIIDACGDYARSRGYKLTGKAVLSKHEDPQAPSGYSFKVELELDCEPVEPRR